MPSAPQTRVLDPRDAQAGEYTAAWDAINKLTRNGSSWSGYERKNVFLNCGKGLAFASVPGATGLDYNDDGRGSAVVDWDGDGAPDLWLRNRTGPRLRLMHNRTRGQHFLSLKLTGTGDTNRDAIGARVTLEVPGQPPLVQTVRAGEGFLSQGTKWMLFGLGGSANIASVSVRWPGGKTESISGIKADGRYHITQGTGKAGSVAAPAPVKLEAKRLHTLPASGRIAVSLPTRVPLPMVSYTTPDGKSATVTNPGRSLLLLLYSHSCPNCAAEMKELTAASGKLREAGLDVLALAVDAASTGKESELAAGFAAMQERQWPWLHGSASVEAVHHLEEFTRALLEYPPPPAVPAAYLMAPGGRVTALYRGPIGLDRLLYDLPTIVAGPDELRDRSIPVAGRWFTSSPSEKGMPEWIFKHFGPSFPAQRLAYLAAAAGAAPEKEKPALHQQLAATHFQLAREEAGRKRLDEAEHHFAESLRYAPENATVHNDFGAVLAFRGRKSEAAAHYRRALEIDPRFALARENLAKLNFP